MRTLPPRLRLPGTARRDALAGFSLASMAIPQVLGYTRIAGTSLASGLYTTLLPVVAFAAFGASRHMVVAADSATAAIFSGTLRAMAEPQSASYMKLAGAVALLSAALLLLARAFQLGFLADFLSRTVLVGFLAGVGLQVAIAMLGDMLGAPGDAHLPWQQLRALGERIAHQGLPQGGHEAALSAAALALLWSARRYAPRLPAGLLVVVLGIAASAVFGFGQRGIAVLGAVGGGLPPLGLPDVTWREALALLPAAASCVIVIVAQSAATARSFALRHGEEEDFNRDLLGLAAPTPRRPAAAPSSSTAARPRPPTPRLPARAASWRN